MKRDHTGASRRKKIRVAKKAAETRAAKKTSESHRRGWQTRRKRKKALLLHMATVIMKGAGSAGLGITAPLEKARKKPRNQASAVGEHANPQLGRPPHLMPPLSKKLCKFCGASMIHETGCPNGS
jgi:hypothetical protein